MERGSNKHGPKLDDEIGRETEALERSGKEARADEYTYKDWGEVGGASHPKPKEGASERAESQEHSQDGQADD